MKILDIIWTVGKNFSPVIIGGTILLTIIMLPVYFIRKKKNPENPKNKIFWLILLSFIVSVVLVLSFGSGLIMMYIDDVMAG